MSKTIDSVLSDAQKESFQIEEFVFHIIDTDSESSVVYLDEVPLLESQKKFFLDRLKETAEGSQYIFDQNNVTMKERVSSFSNGNKDFLTFSKDVTGDFASRHSGNMSSGVFVVSKVKYLANPNDWKYCIFLVKLDDQHSVKYGFKEENGKKIATVELNEHSLSERKSAIQKSALIDMSNVFSWDALAFDRAKRNGLSDYYKSFLGVAERQTGEVLTRNTYKVVKAWAKSIPADMLDDGEDVNSISGRAYNYLVDNDSFDTDTFVNVVCRDSDSNRKAVVEASLREALTEQGIAGQRYELISSAISKRDRKMIYETLEGVRIEYVGEREAANINIDNLPNGEYKVTIRTSKLTPKG